MCNVRLAGDHLYGKWLFTWLSLVMSLMSYFVLSFFSNEMLWMRPGIELSQFLRISYLLLLTLLFSENPLSCSYLLIGWILRIS